MSRWVDKIDRVLGFLGKTKEIRVRRLSMVLVSLVIIVGVIFDLHHPEVAPVPSSAASHPGTARHNNIKTSKQTQPSIMHFSYDNTKIEYSNSPVIHAGQYGLKANITDNGVSYAFYFPETNDTLSYKYSEPGILKTNNPLLLAYTADFMNSNFPSYTTKPSQYFSVLKPYASSQIYTDVLGGAFPGQINAGTGYLQSINVIRPSKKYPGSVTVFLTFHFTPSGQANPYSKTTIEKSTISYENVLSPVHGNWIITYMFP